MHNSCQENGFVVSWLQVAVTFICLRLCVLGLKNNDDTKDFVG